MLATGPKIQSAEHTLIKRKKFAEKELIQIFSSTENCCRIPPTERTVDALEYCREIREITRSYSAIFKSSLPKYFSHTNSSKKTRNNIGRTEY